MRSSTDLATISIALVGAVAGAALLLAYVLLETLRPKMVAFEPLTVGEEGLINYVGIGLMLALVFCALAVARIVRFSTRTQRLSPVHLFAIAGGVLTLLFIFADIALIGDIGKQYQHGLSQPEWGILYGVMAFQVIAIAGLLYAIMFTLAAGQSDTAVSRDSMVYLLAQVVGVLCGGLGFALTLVNFRFPRPLWMVQAQIVPMLVVVLFPYALMATWWLIVKLREGGEWFDEKQRQDLGVSAVVALIAGTAGMALLFVLSLDALQGMVSVLWFPYYAFLTLAVFTSSSLFFGRESLL